MNNLDFNYLKNHYIKLLNEETKIKMTKLVHDTIQSISEYLPKVSNGCVSASSLLYQNRTKEALEIWAQIIDGIEWTVSAINGIQRLGYELDINLEEIDTYLLEIVAALHNSDFITVADLIKYEIGPILNSWLEKVSV